MAGDVRPPQLVQKLGQRRTGEEEKGEKNDGGIESLRCQQSSAEGRTLRESAAAVTCKPWNSSTDSSIMQWLKQTTNNSF
jgi:hypothetical protein